MDEYNVSGRLKNARNVLDARIEMPVNVAVEEPWPGVVCHKTDCNVVSELSNAHDVPSNRVLIVIRRAPRNSHHLKEGQR